MPVGNLSPLPIGNSCLYLNQKEIMTIEELKSNEELMSYVRGKCIAFSDFNRALASAIIEEKKTYDLSSINVRITHYNFLMNHFISQYVPKEQVFDIAGKLEEYMDEKLDAEFEVMKRQQSEG
ncbi:hypothetical protein [Reichenbachiella ulvae]|uniref:DUF4296 domain-containing protein n=1 Tax=Reichenbachiella ulvae TaxID=2980104 RepID=A0ABT3CZU5_9BACT|nr:hypothetical protein [Reichenbachiella ulvae]MCV9389152.1 hypothetical protein [Reichenbachiella ulvae]